MLPHVADRPFTAVRMPDGIGGEMFFQKHLDVELPPFVETVELFSGTNDVNQRYLLCNNLATLLWLGQMGTLEFHVWHSRVDPKPEFKRSAPFVDSAENIEQSILNRPDYLVFDIDPYIYSGKEAPGAEPELNRRAYEKGKEVAFWLRELLDAMALRSWVKTSGKTGLHIFVPIERTITFREARQICELVGQHLLRQHPRDITMDWKVEKRAGKIFIDHNMNRRGATLGAAYSPRPAAAAPVSMPLTWEELQAAYPLDFTIHSVEERLQTKADAWRDFPSAKQSLERVLKLG
jgi:bifunctional non-homologous end joining protein LigD